MSDQFATYDAAYLLGALTPADRSAYEAHLADCETCRRAVNQLAGMPGLLAAVGLDQARAAGEPGPEVPETLLPRLMAEVQRTRFRRRMTNALVGVAAAAVLVVAVVVGLNGSPATGPGNVSPPAAVAQRMVPASPDVPIRATARLNDQPWGTRVVVRCVYRGGGEWPEKLTYTMVVVDRSGGTQQIAAWEAKAGAPIVVDGSTSVPRAQIASVQVRTTDDQPILTLRL
jgi:anti-sigma factor RsiW